MAQPTGYLYEWAVCRAARIVLKLMRAMNLGDKFYRPILLAIFWEMEKIFKFRVPSREKDKVYYIIYINAAARRNCLRTF